MKKTCLLFVALIFSFVFHVYAEWPPEKTTDVSYVPPKPLEPVRIGLPQDLVGQLKREYPGYKLIDKKDYCKEFETKVLPYSEASQFPWAYDALKADFNGDGLIDYSFIVLIKREYKWFAAIQNKIDGKNKPYEITFLGVPVISEPGIDEPAKTGTKEKVCNVFALTEGKTLFRYEGKEKKFYNTYPAPGFVADGDADYYYWDNGVWKSFGYTQ